MEITKRAAQWSAPQAVSKPGICEIKANHAMTHSHSNRGYRKTAPAVSVCMTTTGQSVLLCSHCASYVEVLQWLAQIGHRDDMGTGQLAALAYVWRAELGFVMPSIQGYGSYQTLGRIAHNLNKLVKVGLIKRIGDRYLMRDACPSCLRLVCSEQCHLHMSATDFAPRRETLVLGCGGSPPPSPKPQPCGYLGDSCTAKTPCCRSANRAPIECLAGVCEYR